MFQDKPSGLFENLHEERSSKIFTGGRSSLDTTSQREEEPAAGKPRISSEQCGRMCTKACKQEGAHEEPTPFVRIEISRHKQATTCCQLSEGWPNAMRFCPSPHCTLSSLSAPRTPRPLSAALYWYFTPACMLSCGKTRAPPNEGHISFETLVWRTTISATDLPELRQSSSDRIASDIEC